MTQTDDLKGLLEWRCIGPFRGGRVVAVAGSYHDPNVFYFGACAGGVWKTTDAGTYWQCVSDGFFRTASVGALAVAPSDSNVIYAGTGETTIRIDVSHGDGVYKSTDAGRTWKHVGLADTRHIGKIRVHPQNPDVVYVAALGHAFGPNDERGVFKSEDGGATWRKVLSKSEKAGAVDLSLDANPRIMYAAIWEAYRSFWQISSGGPDSGLWMSQDGGETWEDITRRPGLPKGTLGKIGVAASPAQPGRVWALIEHTTEGGLYRSDDYGATWERVSDNQHLVSRAWYYIHLTADPQDPDTVYVNNLNFWKSSDGGRTFVQIDTPHGDNHDLWIDPQNPQRMIQGNDGGACVSLNGGATWSSIYNQPTAQFYHLTADNRHPYYVYGTQQDNSSIAVPSRSPELSITWADCYIAGTGESGYIAVRPDDPNIVYVGAIGSSAGGGNCLQRYDHRTRQIRLITTWPEPNRGHGAIADKYRFAWTYPIVISPHDPNTLYVAGNIIFKSTDEGQSWQPISPDLTRNDPEKLQPTGGPVNKDAIGAETYCTVFSFVESPHERGLLWAGSDDGLIHLSRDGGASWQNVTPPDLPEWTMITMIEPSPFDPATVYVTGTRYKLDDYRPYVYKTTDYGATWARIDAGIGEQDFTRVVRADPERRGLLYCGTETGLYLSFDDGASWARFQLNLPVAPIHDLLVKGDDLIAATHGRSFWVLDNLAPLRQYEPGVKERPAHLFNPGTVERIMPAMWEEFAGGAPGKNYASGLGTVAAFLETKTPENAVVRTFLDSGANPPRGVVVTYWLKEQPKGEATLAFKDARGEVLRTFSSKKPDAAGAEQPKAAEQGAKTADTAATTAAGVVGEVMPGAEGLEGPTPVHGAAPEAAAPAGAPGEVMPGAEGLEGATPSPEDERAKKELRIPAATGFNRFVWNMRTADAPRVEGKDPPSEMAVAGPVIPPGRYQVTLTVDGQEHTQEFELVKNPAVPASLEDLQAQYELGAQLHRTIGETITAINRMRDLRAQLDGWAKRAEALPNGKGVAEAAAKLKGQVLEVEKALLVPDLRPGWGDAGNTGTRLLEKLISLTAVVGLGDYRPTEQARAVYEEVSGKVRAQIEAFRRLVEDEVPRLNAQIAEAQLGAVVVKP
ncbi:MAG TPA: glycosyl hydrolase [Roseiflexaceae bacterium]|nr:glycosyl hydrolase [Roseiflexaceae bacterium]